MNQLSDELIVQFCSGMKSICKNLSLKLGLKKESKILTFFFFDNISLLGV